MIGSGSYKNLNPYLAKKESALFRQRVAQILDSVRVVSMCNHLGRHVGISLPVQEFLKNSTGRGIAQVLQQALDGEIEGFRKQV